MISILHLITDLDTGGSEATLVRLLARLDRRRFANAVVSLTGEGTQGRKVQELGVPLTSLHMRRGMPGPWIAWKVARAIRAVQPDIVQTWLYHADLLGALVGPAAGVGAVCWNIRCADLDPADHSRPLRFVLWLLARLSARPTVVVVNSVAGRRTHEGLGYRPQRWELIPNGFDVDLFAPSPDRRRAFRARIRIDDDTPVVGLVARYHPMKDHATFIRAATTIAAARPDVRFVMAGRGVDGGNRELCAALTSHGLINSTQLCGEVDDTPALYAGLDVAVCSSYSEAFPNVIGEAMACGIPCVTTAVGDAPQLVGRAGLVVPPRDPAALARAIEEVLAMDPRARQALGISARARIVSDYSLDRAVARYEQLYEQLSDARPCAA